MRRRHQAFLALLIVLLAAALPTAIAQGQQRQFPNTFYGTVTINGGQPAPVGVVVTAVLDKGVIGSERRYPLAITVPGEYGDPNGQKLKVGGDLQGDIVPGSNIQFFLTLGTVDFGPVAERPFVDNAQPQPPVELNLVGTILSTLTVTKVVINDNGGTAVAGAFTITVSGNIPSPASFPGNPSGTVVTLGTGAYSVSESGPSGYTPSQSPDCAGTLVLGEVKTCTFTNDDVAPTTGPGPGGDDDDGGVTPTATPPTSSGGSGGGSGGGTSPTSTPRPATPTGGQGTLTPTAVPPAVTSVPTPTNVVPLTGEPPPVTPVATPTAGSPVTVVPTPTSDPPVDTGTGGGGGDGGFPWWGWALIVLVAASAIGGAAIYYLRVQNA